MKKAMKEWMLAATVTEQMRLAEQAETTRWYLYKIAQGKMVTAETAARIERASIAVARSAKGRLRRLTRGSLSATCAACPYYKRGCEGEK